MTVMSGRAGNQVNNLRAIFEPSSNSASPSSRDRSPAGQEGVKGSESRPLSKVRTSFIAVDRIGPMAPAVGSKKTSDEENNKSAQTGGDEPPSVINGTVDESLSSHGEKTVPQPTPKDDAEKIDEGKEPDHTKSAEGSSLENPPTPSKSANANKAGSNAEAVSDKLNSADGSNPAESVENSSHADQPQDLGEILKGAPFENEVQESSEAGAQATGDPKSEPSPPKQKASPKASLPNGQPKKRLGPKTSSPKTQPGSSRPPAIDTKREGSTEPGKSSASSPTNVKKSPRTPGSPDEASRQPLVNAASPRQSIPAKASNNAGKEIRKAPIPKQPQAATGAKAPTVPASKSRTGNPPTSNPVKKSGTSSPTPKIRPKSPTRPVRLPAGATAATASSAAKTGEAPAAGSLSRAGAAPVPKTSGPSRAQPSGTSRDGVTNTSSSLRKASSRLSLSATSNPTQKAKARTSTASTKAPEGSFLARMMRPTQSSASKVHEKIEHAVVPVRSNSTKPKRKSGGGDEHGQGPNEAPSPPATQPDEQQTSLPTSTEELEGEIVKEDETEPKSSTAVEG